MIERIAIIDLGSNSARLIVMHIYKNGAYNLAYNQKETLRLSEGMTNDQMLQPEAMERAIATLKIFVHMCQLFKVDKILAVATAAVRNAKNGQDFLQMVHRETGVLVRVISGETEAKLGFIGVMNTIDVPDAVLFDLGGGSTELTLIKNRKMEKSISLPFGAVTLTEQFGLYNRMNDSQTAELHAYILEQLRQLSWLDNIKMPLIGVGGTARNIAKMDQKRKNYPFPKVHNYRLGAISFDDLWKELSRTTLAQRRKFPGLSTERADIIVAGVSIVKCLFDITNGSQLIISGCGVREGLFLQYYQASHGEEELIDNILRHSTQNIMLSYTEDVTADSTRDIEHACHVTDMACWLFDDLCETLELSERDKTLLRVASLLHDVGVVINYYDHPRHSAYLIENARLFGLTHREQILTAIIAGWHNAPSTKYFRNKIYIEFLDERDWEIARKLALILAISESLDATQMGLVEKLNAAIDDDKVTLTLQLSEPAPIELQSIDKLAKWFKKDVGLDLVLTVQS